MRLKTALIVIFFIALLGTAFSGYLTYYNYWGGGCQEAIISCSGGGRTVEIFGLPTCVYGFFMFLLVAVLSLIGLATKKRCYLTSNLIISLIGTLFALGVTIYEIWIVKIAVSGLPACAYGFFIYLAALIASYIGFRKNDAQLPLVPPVTPTAPTTTNQ